MPDPAAQKRQQRRDIRAQLPTGEAYREESRMICTEIQRCPAVRRADLIAAFIPMKHEPDILPALRELLRSGKRIALPCCGEEGRMTFRLVSQLETLVPGAYGIPEPDESCPVAAPQELDCVLVPLEAIDLQGYRLGKGGGYYDRYLPSTHAETAGVAFRAQQVERVTREVHDQPLNWLITADGSFEYTTKGTV